MLNFILIYSILFTCIYFIFEKQPWISHLKFHLNFSLFTIPPTAFNIHVLRINKNFISISLRSLDLSIFSSLITGHKFSPYIQLWLNSLLSTSKNWFLLFVSFSSFVNDCSSVKSTNLRGAFITHRVKKGKTRLISMKIKTYAGQSLCVSRVTMIENLYSSRFIRAHFSEDALVRRSALWRGQGWPLSLHHVATVVYIKRRSIWRRSTSTNPSAS